MSLELWRNPLTDCVTQQHFSMFVSKMISKLYTCVMKVFTFYFTHEQRKRSAEGSDEDKETPGKHEKKKSKKDKKKSKEKEKEEIKEKDSTDEVSKNSVGQIPFIVSLPEIL